MKLSLYYHWHQGLDYTSLWIRVPWGGANSRKGRSERARSKVKGGGTKCRSRRSLALSVPLAAVQEESNKGALIRGGIAMCTGWRCQVEWAAALCFSGAEVGGSMEVSFRCCSYSWRRVNSRQAAVKCLTDEKWQADYYAGFPQLAE